MDLSEYTVLDLSWLLPGPYGTMLLGDLGADVIKIEEPTRGDYARWGTPSVEATGMRPLFHAVNRNKRSVTIDLQSEAGRNAFFALVAEADVVFEQFRPGVVDRLGIDYDACREHNEEIVYCSLSGYGQNGPYRNHAGHDINYVGVSGLLATTHSRDSERPAVAGFPVADMSGGMFAAFSIVSALLSRELGTGGEYLDVSMTDVATSLGTGHAWKGLMADELDVDEHLTSRSVASNPYYGVYETKDGTYVTVAALEEKFWEQLLAELDREDLLEYHKATGERAEYAIAELEDEFGKRTRDEWIEHLSDETTVAPLNELEEAYDHPQIRERGMIKSMDLGDGETFDHVAFPAQIADGFDEMRSPAPDHGEHTREVLETVLSTDEVDRLEADGVV